jgi:hypothetical protein
MNEEIERIESVLKEHKICLQDLEAYLDSVHGKASVDKETLREMKDTLFEYTGEGSWDMKWDF